MFDSTVIIRLIGELLVNICFQYLIKTIIS